MAGSINLSLAQQFDITNGRLLSAGKLYFFSPGTTTPQLAYRDSALLLPHPNPITLASDGRVPQLYFADGSIRCRLVNSLGVVQFDSDNILVIGPSSGGGGGASVDPTAIFQTGDLIWSDTDGTRAGWVRDNARTIGSATSGASERANSDCQPLFLYLYATFSDTVCPVITGRGVSAAADWAANKQITLPDKRGYVPGGVDTMGNSAANRYTSVPFSFGNSGVSASLCGEATHALIIAELAAHIHSATTTVDGNPPLFEGPPAVILGSAGSGSNQPSVIGSIALTTTIGSTGSGTAHNNQPRTVLGTFYRKL